MEPHDHALRKIGITVVIAIVLAAMGWVGAQLDRNTRATNETHDQVLSNTVKLNALLKSEAKLEDIGNRVGSLEYRMTTLETRQDKDDARHTEHDRAKMRSKSGHMP